MGIHLRSIPCIDNNSIVSSTYVFFMSPHSPVSSPLFPASPLSLPSLCHSSPSSSSSSLLDVPFDRPNQHLAVLLPKYLWKVGLYLHLIFFFIFTFISNSPIPLPLHVTIYTVACSFHSLNADMQVYNY